MSFLRLDVFLSHWAVKLKYLLRHEWEKQGKTPEKEVCEVSQSCRPW